MNIYVVFSLAAFIFCYIIAIYSYLKDRQNFLNKIFSIQAIFIGTWCLFPTVTLLVPNIKQAILNIKIIYIAAVLTPPTVMHFIFELIRTEKNDKKYKILYLFYIISFFFICLIPTPFFLNDIFFVKGHFAIKLNPFFIFFVLFFGTVLLYAYYELYKAYKKESTGIKKNQYKYVLVAYVIAFTGGLIYFVPSFIKKPELFPHDILIMICIGTMVYAIVKHRLMDISIVLREATIHTLSALAISAIFIIIGLHFFSKPVFIALLFSATLISSLTHEPIKRLLRPIIFGVKFEYQKTISNYSQELVSILNINELANKTIDVIVKAMRLRQGFIMLWDNKKEVYNVKTRYGFEDNLEDSILNDFQLEANASLVNVLKRKKNLFIKNELESDNTPESKEALLTLEK
ncbi:MAG: histidine kinase N-terminal 7TM domain-containing protein, partial [bacterium]